MDSKKIQIALYTIARKETARFLRLWTQTLVPPAMTAVLYFLIFGAFIGSQVRPINGVTYMQFIVPGLVMMAVITSAFSNVATSFFASKFIRNIEELLVSPTPPWVVILGYALGGIARGSLVGIIILLVSLFFTHLSIHSMGTVILFMILTSTLFSLAGLFNGLFAKNFDDVAIIPTFVLTPLIYLGGVFYSIDVLPPFWRAISQANPILYIIDGFRYGFLGFSDVSVAVSIGILFVSTAVLAIANWHLFRKGYGLRS